MTAKPRLTDIVRAEADPAVSIYLPLHKISPEHQKNAVRLRNLVREADNALRANGLDPRPLLKPIAEEVEAMLPVRDPDTRGLGVFADGDSVRIIRLQEEPPASVTIQRGFHLQPMLRLIDEKGRFHVVAFDQQHAELIEANRLGFTGESIDIRHESLEAIWERTQVPPEVGSHATDSPPRGRPEIIRHSAGESPSDYQEKVLDIYVRGIARAVTDELAGEFVPLVPVADPNLLGMFYRHCGHDGLVGKGLGKAPSELGRERLFAEVWPLVADVVDRPKYDALERLRAGLNRGDESVSADEERILRATEEGRVATLLMPRAPSPADREDRQPRSSGTDVRDLLVRRTMEQGGEVLVVEPAELPEGARAAALLRY